MREVELNTPLGDVVQAVEAAAEAAGLRIGLKGTLRSHPGCVHWHFKREGPGTLEATWHPKSSRLWLKVASNRGAPWIEEAIAAFVETFGSR